MDKEHVKVGLAAAVMIGVIWYVFNRPAAQK